MTLRRMAAKNGIEIEDELSLLEAKASNLETIQPARVNNSEINTMEQQARRELDLEED
jgi:hypothetical protein